MKSRIITAENLEMFRMFLTQEEKSAATIEKYMRDVKAFLVFISDDEITKDKVIAYKNQLIELGYAPRSINSSVCQSCW